MKIVTYITPEYEGILQKLLNSAELFGYEITVERIASKGTWELNTSLKPDIVFKHLSIGEPFIITDADSEIIRPINFKMFNDTNLSFRLKRGEELLSGTMFFRPTQETINLTLDWARRSHNRSHKLEQIHLHEAIRESGINFKLLPDSYCAIFDEDPMIDDPVILHHQASRQMRGHLSEAKTYV